jgi:hypothetical protein
MQHHPLGKASRKLLKSARDRVNKPIGAMLPGPNQEGKANSPSSASAEVGSVARARTWHDKGVVNLVFLKANHLGKAQPG